MVDGENDYKIKLPLIKKGQEYVNFDALPKQEGRRILSRESRSEIARSWQEAFTSPSSHDDKRFTYLVRGFQGAGGDLVQRIHVLQAMQRGEAQNMGEDIDLLTHPHRIGDRKIISTSVIDQDHRTTFGDAGLILATPFENIVDAGPEDLAINFLDPDKVIATSRRNVCSVSELLSASAPDAWNEVLLMGSTEAGKVVVQGVWIKVDSNGRPIDPNTAAQVSAVARAKGLPLVRIESKVEFPPFEDQKALIHKDFVTVTEGDTSRLVDRPWAFSFNRNGLRYFVDFRRNTSSVITPEKKSRDMTKQELAYACRIIQNELDDVNKHQFAGVLEKLSNEAQE